MIDVKKAWFRIVKVGQEFAIVVKYEGKKFIASKGTLEDLRPKFLTCVHNREVLIPVIERALMG